MRYEYIDIHTHLNLNAFQDDRVAVEKRALAESVGYINVGTGLETSELAVHLLGEGIWGTVGVHPTRAGGANDDDGSGSETIFDTGFYRNLGKNDGIVGIGECGFDYFRVEKETQEKQEIAFIAQIELANELKKPLMLHIRDQKGKMDAYEDALRVIQKYAKVGGNVHFFAGTYALAKKFWDIGYTTSFTGVITFAREYDDVIKNAPLSMLHAETDAPYVTPHPFRGTRNEPIRVKEVVKMIALLRGIDEEVARVALLENARRIFSLPI